MTIELTPKTLVRGLWFIGDNLGDVLMAFWRDETGVWRVDTRIRTCGIGAYDPTSPDNTDRKSWLGGSLAAGTDIEAEFKKLEGLVGDMRDKRAQIYRTKPELDSLPIPVGGMRGDEAGDLLTGKNWAHIQPTARVPTGGARA